MREEAVAAFGTAPWRDRGAVDAELRDFRTYLITLTANPYTAMHYDLSRGDISVRRQLLDGARKHATGRATPTCVQERYDALVRQREIHRDAVGDRDGEQHAGLRAGIPIDAIEDQPALGQLLVPPN